MTTHPDDEFHPPTSDDPYWTETCWFTFTVPERKLSGQLYPFFRPNQKVAAGGAYFWDDTGRHMHDCLYAKNFWHLPLPDQPLSDIQLPNGISYRCLEPQKVYEVKYADPDGGDEISVDLTFTGVLPPHYLGDKHVDQPGRYTGEIVLRGEVIPVDAYGFRDRSWGVRSQFGQGLMTSPAKRGGYSYATASENDAFHAITMDFGTGCVAIHGYVLRDGVWSKLAKGRREVVERDDVSGWATRVVLEGVDELGRELHAEGRMENRLGFFLNPNLFTVNCLAEWTFDGVTAYGEDHENFSAAEMRRFSREFRGEKA
ncbi:DUF7064 domain-containing protein [Yinghuangia seranimata]|uniref:DUF7064 domain-containing protein n=1 Tax=Yinghuangia seranimata TaxID=408067 RepID=UPI00248BAC55|nr:hypothetical protein [Yinghuangia seranimata]MDI2127273.1 hypothetical protein [Yinghuangia seranimata]MDI2132218.1 hypothetical protein [Yinghuangia seranimata]